MFDSVAQLNEFISGLSENITEGGSEVRCRRVIDFLMLIGNHDNTRYVTSVTSDHMGYNIIFCSRNRDYSDFRLLLNTTAARLENIIPELTERISEICYPLNREKSYYINRLEMSLSNNELSMLEVKNEERA